MRPTTRQRGFRNALSFGRTRGAQRRLHVPLRSICARRLPQRSRGLRTLGLSCRRSTCPCPARTLACLLLATRARSSRADTRSSRCFSASRSRRSLSSPTIRRHTQQPLPRESDTLTLARSVASWFGSLTVHAHGNAVISDPSQTAKALRLTAGSAAGATPRATCRGRTPRSARTPTLRSRQRAPTQAPAGPPPEP